MSAFIEHSNVFNTGDRGISLSKVKLYGIGGLPHRSIKSYLTNRTHRVRKGSGLSDMLTMTRGLHQVLCWDVYFSYFI